MAKSFQIFSLIISLVSRLLSFFWQFVVTSIGASSAPSDCKVCNLWQFTGHDARSIQLILYTCSVALYQIRTLSLPISSVIGIAGVILPVANAAGLQGIRSLLGRSNGSTRRNAILSGSTVSIFLFLMVYETAIATLSLTHMAPADNLACALDRNWERLFRSKDEARIRRIQDAHQCCGLHSIRDRAWPFEDQNHKVDACAKTFNRTKACFGSWRRDEQIAAGLLLVVAIAVFLLKVSCHPVLGVLLGGKACLMTIMMTMMMLNHG
jgi:hypothetical protein